MGSGLIGSPFAGCLPPGSWSMTEAFVREWEPKMKELYVHLALLWQARDWRPWQHPGTALVTRPVSSSYGETPFSGISGSGKEWVGIEAQKGTQWPLPLTDWFEGTYWLLEVTGRIERVRMIPGSMGSTQKAQSCCILDVVINIMSLELIAYGGLQHMTYMQYREWLKK